MTFDQIPDDWELATLGEVATDDGLVGGPFGSSLGQKDYVADGVPVIRGTNIRSSDRFNQEDLVFVTQAKVERDLLRNTAVPGDIILTQRGTLGQVGVIPDGAYPLWVISQSQERLRVDRTKADRDFVYFVLQSPAMVGEITRRAITTGVPHINLGITQELPMPLPPLEEQHRISLVLGSIDRKIENSLQIARTLEEIASTLYTARFVDFVDYPDLVESEVGPIPREWEVGSIYRIADVTYGRPFKSALFNKNEGIPLVRIRDLASDDPSVRTLEKRDDARLITAGDIVVGMDGEFRAHLWSGPDAWLNQRVCAFDPRDGTSRAFLLEALKRPLAFFEATKSGTTVIHLGKRDIDTFKIALPPSSVMKEFAHAVDPLLKAAVALRVESRTLSGIRDSLLPRLVTGDLRVNRTNSLALLT